MYGEGYNFTPDDVLCVKSLIAKIPISVIDEFNRLYEVSSGLKSLTRHGVIGVTPEMKESANQAVQAFVDFGKQHLEIIPLLIERMMIAGNYWLAPGLYYRLTEAECDQSLASLWDQSRKCAQEWLQHSYEEGLCSVTEIEIEPPESFFDILNHLAEVIFGY